jgi:DNA-binding NtrC family response regulator
MSTKLLGDSVQIKEINETIKQVAPTDVSILITGESGSGKEVVANSIFRNSKRADKPFVIVNCGAIPEGIIESELFGHQKGAFTGAIEERKGYFEMADNGTIFLDEIGEMPVSTQVKFLRVLETGEFMRVGGSKTIRVDVRIIAATNKDLAEEVLQKNFREDLYYRLRSINIYIPPLRERRADIRLLFFTFIDNYSQHNSIQFHGIDDDAMDYIINYSWPGNARELKNFCESILVLVPGRMITLEDVKKQLKPDLANSLMHFPVPFSVSREQKEKDFLFRALVELKSDIIDIKESLAGRDHVLRSNGGTNHFTITEEDMGRFSMDDIEKEVILYVLDKHGWNVERAAAHLKQTSRNIYKKMKKYGISRESRWRN